MGVGARVRSLSLVLVVMVSMLGGACGDGGGDPAGDVPPAALVAQLRYGSDPAQFGWLRLPSAPPPQAGHPVVVLVHGGFWSEPWDYTLMTPMAEELQARGIATWNIEFRRLGGRGGWPTTFDDVAAALIHLESLGAEHPLDLDAVVIAGHSSGGHLALWAAGDAGAHTEVLRPAAAVGIAAITDLERFFRSAALLGGTLDEVPDRWAFAAPSLDPAVVRLVHGTRDDIVAIDTVQHARDAGVGVVELDADHFEVIERGPVMAAVVDEIVEALARG